MPIFGRAILFCMLGHYSCGAEDAILSKASFHHRPGPFPKQVRRDPFEIYRDGCCAVRELKPLGEGLAVFL